MQPRTSAPPDEAAAAPRGLRPIPGSYDITRWPIAITPLTGEHPASWLRRAANRYRLAPNALLSEAGAPTSRHTPHGVAAHLREHHELLRDRLGPAPDPDDPPLRHLDTVDEALQQFGPRYRVQLPPTTFRYCPTCLAQHQGGWMRAWLTRAPTVCGHHGTWLRSTCPGCGNKAFTTQAWTTARTPPWICCHISGPQPQPRRRRLACGYDLRTAPTLSPTEEQARAHHHLDAWASAAMSDPGAPVEVCEVPTTAQDRVEAVLELIDELADLKSALTDTSPGADPACTARFTEDLQQALSVLSQPDALAAAAHADRLGLLDPAGKHTPIGTSVRIRDRRHNPLLGAIRLRSLGPRLSPTAQLTFRTTRACPRYPEPNPVSPHLFDQLPTSWPDQSELSWIPQALWPGALGDLVDDDDLGARVTASMLLARVGSTRPWHLIALDLGLPARFARTPPARIRTMRREGTWEPMLAALDELSTGLEQSPPPINYSRRRWAAADGERLTNAVRHARTLHQTSPLTDQALAPVLWQTYTGGHITLHRDPHATTWPTLTACVRHHRHDEHLEDLLLTAAAALHDLAGGVDDGPLRWHPP